MDCSVQVPNLNNRSAVSPPPVVRSMASPLFQDALSALSAAKSSGDGADSAAEIFFDLANADEVSPACPQHPSRAPQAQCLLCSLV